MVPRSTTVPASIPNIAPVKIKPTSTWRAQSGGVILATASAQRPHNVPPTSALLVTGPKRLWNLLHLASRDALIATFVKCFTLERIVVIRASANDPKEKGRQKIRWPHERPPQFELPNVDQLVIP